MFIHGEVLLQKASWDSLFIPPQWLLDWVCLIFKSTFLFPTPRRVNSAGFWKSSSAASLLTVISSNTLQSAHGSQLYWRCVSPFRKQFIPHRSDPMVLRTLKTCSYKQSRKSWLRDVPPWEKRGCSLHWQGGDSRLPLFVLSSHIHM